MSGSSGDEGGAAAARAGPAVAGSVFSRYPTRASTTGCSRSTLAFFLAPAGASWSVGGVGKRLLAARTGTLGFALGLRGCWSTVAWLTFVLSLGLAEVVRLRLGGLGCTGGGEDNSSSTSSSRDDGEGGGVRSTAVNVGRSSILAVESEEPRA